MARMTGGLRSGGAILPRIATWQGGVALSALALALAPLPAWAQSEPIPADMGPIEGLALILIGGLGAGVLAAFSALARQRRKAADNEKRFLTELEDASSRMNRLGALLTACDDVSIIYPAGDGKPEIFGDLSQIDALPDVEADVTRFRGWLDPLAAERLEPAIAALRQRGEGFTLDLKTQDKKFVSVFGRAMGRDVIVRFRDLTGDRERLAASEMKANSLARELDGIRALMEALEAPMWRRDARGRLVEVNDAFADAMEAESVQDAVAKGIELLEAPQRAAAMNARIAGQVYRAEVPLIFAGKRRLCDVIDVDFGDGSIGIALDASERTSLQARLTHKREALKRSLDAATAGMAVFGADRSLLLYNAAFSKIFAFTHGYLETSPDINAIMTDLRARRQVPEDKDFSGLRESMRKVFSDNLDIDDTWRLPDGRTLTVRARAHECGGASFSFDNETQRIALASQVNALLKVQRDTLDGLREGVAVFGADGKLKLKNAAFAATWSLNEVEQSAGTHASTVLEAIRRSLAAPEALDPLRGFIGSLTGGRSGLVNRLTLKDSRVIDLNAVPLVDGATLLSFHDVTDTVKAAERLKTSNAQLEEASRIKTSFVQHVSYELRSPLTSVIGFADMIAAGKTDNMTERQLDYITHIRTAGASLMALVNSILDLASIDAGVMALNLLDTDIESLINDAIDGLRDRLEEKDIRIDVDVPGGLGMAHVDPQRLRQVVYNLVSNAVHWSAPGSCVRVKAQGKADALTIVVIDRGIGMSKREIARAFEAFETTSDRGGRQGPGLGLTLARKFIELHGGALKLWSREGVGTIATCIIPGRTGTA